MVRNLLITALILIAWPGLIGAQTVPDWTGYPEIRRLPPVDPAAAVVPLPWDGVPTQILPAPMLSAPANVPSAPVVGEDVVAEQAAPDPAAPEVDKPADKKKDDTGGKAEDAKPRLILPYWVPSPVADTIFLEEKLWESSFELGLDGTEGSSQTFNLRFGFEAERKTEENEIDVDLDYNKKTSNGTETANRMFLDWRFERLFEESRWTQVFHGTVEFDEFEEYDSRISFDVGLGYQVIDDDDLNLTVRLGSGFSREVGGPDDVFVPEMVAAFTYKYQVSDRQKISASAEYAPDVTNFNDYRVKNIASWEMLIDKDINLSVKLSMIYRFDSTSHDDAPNDLDYAAVLMWTF